MGKQTGKGMRKQDGCTFDGLWEDATLVSGECLFPDGSRYIGEWKAGRPTGEGYMYWPDGDREFKGEFAGGAPLGVATKVVRPEEEEKEINKSDELEVLE